MLDRQVGPAAPGPDAYDPGLDLVIEAACGGCHRFIPPPLYGRRRERYLPSLSGAAIERARLALGRMCGGEDRTVGSRKQALQPIATGRQELFGSLGPDVARGLALRMDHGTQYLSDHVLNQIRDWVIQHEPLVSQRVGIKIMKRRLWTVPDGSGRL